MNPTQIIPSQPRTIQLRPDSPALQAVRHDPGRPTRQRAGAGLADSDQPAPVPPRRHSVPDDLYARECLAGFFYGALLLAVLMAAMIWGGAL